MLADFRTAAHRPASHGNAALRFATPRNEEEPRESGALRIWGAKMAEKTFSAEIDGWVRQTRERIEFVFREAAQDLAEEVVAKAPIDTGFLRHSFTASGEQMPVIRADARPAEGAKYAFDSAAVNLTIANVPLGGTIYFGFVAKYALRIEHGFVGEDSLGRSFNQPGRGMVRLAAMNWKWHVAEATARAKAAVRSQENR